MIVIFDVWIKTACMYMQVLHCGIPNVCIHLCTGLNINKTKTLRATLSEHVQEQFGGTRSPKYYGIS